MRRAAILDTSWLFELYRVPGYSRESRAIEIRDETADVVDADGSLFVTVPVLFEVASHITHVRDGNRRRRLGRRLFKDVEKSFARGGPWTIAALDGNILLRSEDVVRLADHFLQETGPNHSFANISIIDLATELRKRDYSVRILIFNEQLAAYSDQ